MDEDERDALMTKMRDQRGELELMVVKYEAEVLKVKDSWADGVYKAQKEEADC